MIDLTAYCWRVERTHPNRVRVSVHTVPGLERALAKSLKEVGVRTHRRCRGCLWVSRPADVGRFVAQVIGPDAEGWEASLARAVEDYVRAATLRGNRDETERCVAAVVEWAPKGEPRGGPAPREPKVKPPRVRKDFRKKRLYAPRGGNARLVRIFAAAKEVNGCDLCTYRGPAWTLHWHHIDPKTRKDGVGHLLQHRAGLHQIWAEVLKCQCLCGPCHTEAHRRLRAEAK